MEAPGSDDQTLREQSLRTLQTGVEEILLGYETIFENMLGYEKRFVKIVGV